MSTQLSKKLIKVLLCCFLLTFFKIKNSFRNTIRVSLSIGFRSGLTCRESANKKNLALFPNDMFSLSGELTVMSIAIFNQMLVYQV